MNNNSRTANTIKNSTTGILVQIITALTSFVVRTIFIKTLSTDYLGVNGLFTNVLSILSLAELGFGSAMVYSLYKPLAEKDFSKIRGLMGLYAKVYKMVGLFILIIGLLLMPFLPIIIKDAPNVDNLYLIYILFLINSVFSYFFSYKRSMLQADQSIYIISRYHFIVTLAKSILQSIVLLVFYNYILYLIIQIISTLMENILISNKVNQLYPFLKSKENESLSKTDKDDIVQNVKALSIYKLGTVMLDSTDDILISSIVGIKGVGLVSNYNLIINTLSTLLSQITNSLTGSVGNYVVTKSIKGQESLLYRVTFVYYIVYGTSTIMLFMLMNPFIRLWIGESYILPQSTVAIICFNWYFMGMMNPVWTFRQTKGLFIYGRFRPFISGILNIIISIILGNILGLNGVLLGTTIARVSTNFWYDPYIIFRKGFDKSPNKYVITQVVYILLMLIPIVISLIVISHLPEINLLIFIIQILIILIVCMLFYFILSILTKHYAYLLNIIKSIVRK